MRDFTCQRCGICCHQLSATLTPEDMNREPRLWDVAVPIQNVRNPKTRRYMKEKRHPWAIDKEKRGAPCPFLVQPEGKPAECSIHETRPQICRDYPGKAKCIREERENAPDTKHQS